MSCIHLVQSISVAFEHCVLRVVVAYCVARQRCKNYQFSQLRNITESKGRLDIPFLWQSVKLFTTKPCYTTTTRNTQCSNATEIDCNITPCIDVGVVISDNHHLRGGDKEGVRHSLFIRELGDSHVSHVFAMAPCSAYIMNKNHLTHSSMFCIYTFYVMKRKPHLHDGTVMEDTDKNRLAEISPSGREPPDVILTRIR